MKYLFQVRFAAIRLGRFLFFILLVGASVRLPAEEHTSNVLDGVTNDLAGPFILGDTGPFNFLLVTNGGALIDTTGTVGNSAESRDNLAIVTGTNSIWNNNGGFVLGATGAVNQLTLQAGGRLQSSSAIIGSDVLASNNVAILSGAGTSWRNNGAFTIGQFGANNAVSLSDNAQIIFGGAIIGDSSSGNQVTLAGGANGFTSILTLGNSPDASFNLVRLDGAGTGLTNRDSIALGGSGSQNSIIVSNGASLYPGIFFPTFTIGDGTPSRSNLFLLTGAGSKYVSGASLIVGRYGADNRVVIADGGMLKTASARISADFGSSNNHVFVTGPGSAWTNGTTDLGYFGRKNSLVISNGARAVIGAFSTGFPYGGEDVVLVTDPDSLLKSTAVFNFGQHVYFGQHVSLGDKMSVLNGARFEAGSTSINGALTAAFVAGTGTTWSNVSLAIGGDGGSWNTFIHSDGARLDSGQLIIGPATDASENSLLVRGGTTILNIQSNLTVGDVGSRNRLTLSAGAVANVTSNVIVGNLGALNRLEIREGAQLNDWSATIGSRFASFVSSAISNSVLVTGPGSSWNHGDTLIVGDASRRANLVISDGGQVNDLTAVIGRIGVGEGGCEFCPYSSSSRVLVTDPGSIWSSQNRLVVGGASAGNALIITNGAKVVAGNVVIGELFDIGGNPCIFGQTNNSLTDAGGFLVVTNAFQDAVLEARSGVLRLMSGDTVADRLLLTNCLASQIDFRSGTLRVRDTLVTNGAPLVVGDGLHTAKFQIDPLTPFNDLGNLLASPRLVIRPHASLTGAGRLLGPTTNLGTIAPGFPLEGRLFVHAPLGLGPASVLHFDVAGNTGGFNYDYLDAIVPLAFNGSLRVTLRNGYVPPAAQVFRVITGPVLSGAFTNVSFGSRLKTTDNLGSFVVTTNNNAVELTDYQSTDLDGDGIEDAWANAHFSHSPLTPAEKLADADHDGASNYDEFRAGTDPNDPASAFKATLTYANGRATLSFPCVEGRNYFVSSSADLVTWTVVSDPTFAYPAPGRCEWTDDGKDTGGLGGGARFYGVTVE